MLKRNNLLGIIVAIMLVGGAVQNCVFAQDSTGIVMPSPRIGMCSAKIGNRVYLIGGATHVQNLQSYSFSNLMMWKGTDLVTVYDFKTNNWDTKVAPLNVPRVFATAVSIGDSIYVMGGIDDQGHVLNSVEVFDTTSKEWHFGPDMLSYRYGAASVAYGDSVLVFGGAGYMGPQKSVEVYSPANGSWDILPDPTLFKRVFHQAVRIGRSVYILGGITPVVGPDPYIERYVPNIGTVQVGLQWKTPRYFFGAVVRNNLIYAISGLWNQGLLPNSVPLVEQLSVASTDSETEDDAPVQPFSPRAAFVADVSPDGNIYLFGGVSLNDDGSNQAPVASVEKLAFPTTAIDNRSAVAEKFDLMQNYPNPFNPTTTIVFDVPSPGMNISLEVFNVLGQKVATLVKGYTPAGEHSAFFSGANLTSGVYIYRLSNVHGSTFRKMVLIK